MNALHLAREARLQRLHAGQPRFCDDLEKAALWERSPTSTARSQATERPQQGREELRQVMGMCPNRGSHTACSSGPLGCSLGLSLRTPPVPRPQGRCGCWAPHAQSSGYMPTRSTPTPRLTAPCRLHADPGPLTRGTAVLSQGNTRGDALRPPTPREAPPHSGPRSLLSAWSPQTDPQRAWAAAVYTLPASSHCDHTRQLLPRDPEP